MQPASADLLKTWDTGLDCAGLNFCVKIDDVTIAVSGEEEKESVISYKTLNGHTIKTMKMGKEQIRSVCMIKIEKEKFMVLTKRGRIELWDPQKQKLLDKLRVEDFDPCAICVASWNTVLVANWAQETPNLDDARVNTIILEIQIIGGKLQKSDRRLEIHTPCIIGMVRVFYRMHRIIVITSYNNDMVFAVKYENGERVWRIAQLEYEGSVIRPNAICSDGSGYVYITDTGLSCTRIFVLSSGGMIVKKLMDIPGWCDDLVYIAEEKRLVIIHDKEQNEETSEIDTDLINKNIMDLTLSKDKSNKRDISVYNIHHISLKSKGPTPTVPVNKVASSPFSIPTSPISKVGASPFGFTV